MTTLAYPREAFSIKPVVYVAVALVISFGLFVVMAKLIETDDVTVVPPQTASVGPVTLQLEEEKVIVKHVIKPQPKPVEPPPTLKPQDPDNEPIVASNNSYVGGPAIERITIDNSFTFGKGDQEVRPVVRVDPSYPAEAARDGVEGWVSLRFTIDPLGGVRDIEVIDAEPKRIFDREARRALAKWKYQPRTVEGKAVAQHGMQVMLEFKLQD